MPTVSASKSAAKEQQQQQPVKQQDNEAAKSQIELDFNKLIADFIRHFHKYELTIKYESCLFDDERESEENEKVFADFIAKFDELNNRLAWSKRENNHLLLSLFNQSNMSIIKLYELIFKFLNNCTLNNFKTTNKKKSIAETNEKILNKTMEFLHILTTSNLFISI